MHAMDPIDGLLGLRRRPERGGGQEVGGALEPAPGVAAIVGVVGDTGHRQRVQRLEQQRSEPADEHRCVGVDPSDRGIVVEPARLVGVEQFGAPCRRIGSDHPAADLFAHPRAHVGGHWLIVPRPHEYHPDVPEDSSPDPDARPAAAGRPVDESGRPLERRATDRTLPRWVLPAILLFWVGYLLTITGRHVFHRLSSLLVLLLVSVFLSLAIEPGVNKLAVRGWRRGRATIMILLGVLTAFLIFAGAVGTLVGTQVADLLSESDAYITDTVNFLNDNFGSNIDPQDVIDEFNDPDGRVQEFIQSQSDEAVRLSVAVVGVIFQALSVLLFTYYLVADGPRMRRCDLLAPEPGAPGRGAEGVGTGDHQDRRLPLLASAARVAVGVLPLDRVPVDRHAGADRPGALGRPRQPVPPGGRHLPRRDPAGAVDVARLAAQSRDRDRVHRRLPADRELLLRAAHHRSHDGTPPGRRVRCSARWCVAARLRRGVAGVAGRGDGAGARQRVGKPLRRDGQSSHVGARTAIGHDRAVARTRRPDAAPPPDPT